MNAACLLVDGCGCCPVPSLCCGCCLACQSAISAARRLSSSSWRARTVGEAASLHQEGVERWLEGVCCCCCCGVCCCCCCLCCCGVPAAGACSCCAGATGGAGCWSVGRRGLSPPDSSELLHHQSKRLPAMLILCPVYSGDFVSSYLCCPPFLWLLDLMPCFLRGFFRELSLVAALPVVHGSFSNKEKS